MSLGPVWPRRGGSFWQQSFNRRPAVAPAGFGIGLIAVGVGALILHEGGVNLFTSVGARGWPLPILVPGLVLLAASLVPASPRGIGLATSGAVVSTVGAILLYQSNTGHWQSWSYAWALIPMFAGVATALYGLLSQVRSMVVTGLWTAGISAGLFIVGAWFEGLFAGEERRLIDAGNWWPVALIVLGVVVAILVITARPAAPPAGEPTTPAGG